MQQTTRHFSFSGRRRLQMFHVDLVEWMEKRIVSLVSLIVVVVVVIKM
jgi:hypothetical protein